MSTDTITRQNNNLNVPISLTCYLLETWHFVFVKKTNCVPIWACGYLLLPDLYIGLPLEMSKETVP